MNDLEIESVVGREILDSRGNPTVEAALWHAAVHLPAHPLVSLKLWSCGTATRAAIWARV